MEVSSLKDSSSVASSPLSSPNISTLLKIKVLSWSQETGLPASIRVRVCDKSFNLHKDPLFSKSGYFKKREDQSSSEIELPQDFPGGPETFELILLFIYGSPMLIDPFNVAALRCAAEFLEMTEEQSAVNLCERFDLYLNQVVLQNWDDALIVLQKCQSLLPWSEELLIDSRCIESLAFMACMEILDPERRRENSMVTLEGLANQPWSCETAKKIMSQELWIKDITALPFGFFKRVIGSLRRQGMKEKYVSPVIVFYTNKWMLLEKVDDTSNKITHMLQGIFDLLFMREKASGVIPVGFYFAFLSRSLNAGLKRKNLSKLQDQIASQLHIAHVEDFLYPETRKEPVSFSRELLTMQSIFLSYASSNTDSNHTTAKSSVVAKLWDMYLCRIAHDPKLDPKKFMELIETVPISFRTTHDQLYRAVTSFLQTHKAISQEEKGSICNYLSCQKLSQEACVEAVQNELMPLRLIVQALFIQQLNTHQTLQECSDSFRLTHYGDFSDSLPSSRCPNSNPLALGESPCTDGAEPRSRPLGILMQRDSAMEDYESTSFRIQNLEQELISLKKSLQFQSNLKKTEPTKTRTVKTYGLEKRSLSKKRNTFGQLTGCIGSVNFASQRKYANRLLRVFRRVMLFGSRKSKKKAGDRSLWV